MLTRKSSDTATDAAAAAAAPARAVGDLVTYFEGGWYQCGTRRSRHDRAFMYGTATFEGIRGYWNAEHE